MTVIADRPDSGLVSTARAGRAGTTLLDGPLPGWPLILPLVGIPVWWVLGFAQIAFFIAAIPMAGYLLRERVIRGPRSLSVWLLFLGWLLAGLLTLRIDAPGALPESGFGSYLTFGYRFSWYVVGTIFMLYVANSSRILSTERIAGALSYLFLILVGGGYLGLLMPTLEFPSALEIVLPRRLASNGLVSDLIHPQAAQVQSFLGGRTVRPSAPFAYTNMWALNLALTMPFFVAEWWRRGGRWRGAVVPLCVVAAVPAILSLNRGLWGAILVVVVFLAVRAALSGRVVALVGLIVVSIVAVAAIAVSPAGDLISQRLQNQHSNEGRGNLGALSVQSAWEGSPLIGFGSTRDVAGNFNSIAGGATDDCPLCSPPPLGTQGQLWMLVFASGFGGLALYLLFLGSAFFRHLRTTSPLSVAALCAILISFVTLPVYDMVGLGVLIVLMSVGILSRESAAAERPSLNLVAGKVARNVGVIVACAGLGGIAAGTFQISRGSEASATQSVVVPAANLTGTASARPLTLDSEALIATSAPVLTAVRDAVGAASDSDVSERITITAEPNSRILNVTYSHDDARTAELAASTAVSAYLDAREELITEAADSIDARIGARSSEIDADFASAIQSLPALGDSPILRSAYADIQTRARSSLAAVERENEGDRDPGRQLSPPTVFRSTDQLVVRIASGAAVGALIGLGIASLVDRRRHRLGPRPAGRLAPFDLSTVARVSPDSVGSEQSADMTRAMRSAAAYFPLAAIVADPRSPASIELARRLDDQVGAARQRRGRRVLVVAEERSRHESVYALLRACDRNGNEPVGLLLIG